MHEIYCYRRLGGVSTAKSFQITAVTLLFSLNYHFFGGVGGFISSPAGFKAVDMENIYRKESTSIT